MILSKAEASLNPFCSYASFQAVSIIQPSLFPVVFPMFRFLFLYLGLVVESWPSSELTEEEELLWQATVP
jgi:hypothetical protein